MASECTGYIKDVAQVGAAILVGRGTYRGKHHLHIVETFGKRGDEMEASGLYITTHKLPEPRLVDRYLTGIKPRYLFCIYVDTCHINPHLGKTCSRDKTDITCSDYRYIHYNNCLFKSYSTNSPR